MMSKCKEFALWRYTWPGEDEAFICVDHGEQLQNVARAIGMHLQLIAIAVPVDKKKRIHCSQNISKE